MLYRLFSRFNDDVGLLVFVVYLIAFALAFVLVFIFPPGALVLVFLGLVGFVGIWAILLVTRASERSLARKHIRGGSCPVCGGSTAMVPGPGDPEQLHHCEKCSQDFEVDGRRYRWDDAEEGEHESAAV